MDHIEQVQKDGVVLTSGHVVPVSQKRRKLVREALFQHIQTKL